MRKLLFLGIFMAMACSMQAQAIQKLLFSAYDDIVGLDFSSDPPSLFYTGISNGFEAISHAEDGNGNIVFWVNSNGVYDINSNLMPNSTGLNANSSSAEISVFPFPSDPSKFYIVYNDQLCSSMFYCIVDLTLNGGLGDVTAPNTLISNSEFSEGFEVVRIPCTENYYILAYECDVGIWSFLVNDTGINTTGTFLQAVNTPMVGTYAGRTELDYHFGRLGMSYGNVENTVFLGDYDPLTNTLNGANIPVPSLIDQGSPFPAGMMGIDFSPDGTKAYVANWLESGQDDIFCYDFNTASWINQWNSLTILGTTTTSCGQIELGPDNRIYILNDLASEIIVFDDVNNGNPIISTISTTSSLAIGISDHIQSDLLLPMDTSNVEIICLADSVHYQVSFEVLNGVGPFSVQGVNGDFVANTFTSENIPSGEMFSLVLTDALTCSDPIIISGEKECSSCQAMAALSGDTLVCEENFDPFDVSIEAFGTAPYELTYSLNGEGQTPIVSSSTPININVTEPGTIEILSLTDGDCTVSLSGIYEINTIEADEAGTGSNLIIEMPDSTIYSLFDYVADASTLSGQWYEPSGETSAGQIGSNLNSPEGLYYYVVPATDLCPADTAFVGVLIVPEPEYELVYFPNAFTPNDDGNNDEFKANGLSGNETVTMSIYNRWGERVFYTPDALSEGWDGTFRGSKMNAGVYVYTAKTLNPQGELTIFQGNFTLLR